MIVEVDKEFSTALNNIRTRIDGVRAEVEEKRLKQTEAATAEALRILRALPDAVEAAVRADRTSVVIMELTGDNALVSSATCTWAHDETAGFTRENLPLVAQIIHDAIRMNPGHRFALKVMHEQSTQLILAFT